MATLHDLFQTKCNCVYAYEKIALAELQPGSDCVSPTQKLDPDSGPESENLLEDDSDDDDEFLESYNARPIVEVLAENITAAIDRLYRLSFKVRNPATRYDLSRGLRFKEVDRDTGVDFLTLYELFDLAHVKEIIWDLRNPERIDSVDLTDGDAVLYEKEDNMVGSYDDGPQITSRKALEPDRLDNDFLVRRLAHANNVRRRQFRYWQTHQEKLASMKVEVSASEPPRMHSNRVGPLPVLAMSFATTEATKVKEDDIELSDSRSVLSSATYAMMQTEPGRDEVSLPPFPRWLEDKKEFECPYCRIMCPQSMSRKSAWE